MSMSKEILDSFETMFRQYVQRVTGMKTNCETESVYGENKGEDIPDDALISFQEAVNKWEIDNLEKHYIRDKVVKDNLNDTLKKYKSLKDLIDQAKKALDDFQNHVVVIENNKFVVIEE